MCMRCMYLCHLLYIPNPHAPILATRFREMVFMLRSKTNGNLETKKNEIMTQLIKSDVFSVAVHVTPMSRCLSSCLCAGMCMRLWVQPHHVQLNRILDWAPMCKRCLSISQRFSFRIEAAKSLAHCVWVAQLCVQSVYRHRCCDAIDKTSLSANLCTPYLYVSRMTDRQHTIYR